MTEPLAILRDHLTEFLGQTKYKQLAFLVKGNDGFDKIGFSKVENYWVIDRNGARVLLAAIDEVG